MPINEQIKSDYDEVPFLNSSIPMSRPDSMSVVAAIAGFESAAVTDCRVLDIGCAEGHNLLPMAQALPSAQFLGVDLSPRQVEAGNETIRRVGLTNVQLRCQDLMDFADEGQFDFIIAHGFYSWVPQEVRDRALAICRRSLSPRGLAYFSYNTLPGWHLNRVARDMMVYHARRRAGISLREQAARAREIIALAAELPEGRPPYLAVVKDLARLIGQRDDSMLVHDDLGVINDPVFFADFVRHAQAHGLGYVASATPTMDLFRWLPPKFQDRLREFSDDEIEREQYLEFLTGSTFRASVLCRDDAAATVDHAGPLAVRSMLAAGRIKEEPAQPAGAAAFFHVHAPKKRVTLTEPASIAAFRRIQTAWPRAVSFTDLLQTAPMSAVTADADAASKKLVENLLLAYQITMIELWTRSTDFMATGAVERPRATPLARFQAAAGASPINLRHEPIACDPAIRLLLPLLDGTRDRLTLRKDLAKLADQGVWRPNASKGPVNRTELYGHLDRIIENFAANSLLWAG